VELVSSDQDLVTEIRSGSGDAFDRLMRRYRGLVYRVAYGFTGERESAMDVVQDTFLKVHARLGSWRGDGDLKNWIARIAANALLDRFREFNLKAVFRRPVSTPRTQLKGLQSFGIADHRQH
jgi:RNA polymerase sigma-70 factor (ECF subfamily)